LRRSAAGRPPGPAPAGSRRRPAVVLACLIASFPVLSGCESLFFHPRRAHVPNPYLDMVSREDVFFTASDGVRLHGWFLRPPGSPKGAILYLHGNSGNISTFIGSVLWLALAGYQVFLPDYRGYGRSAGRPDIQGIHRDALGALETLFSIEGVRTDRVAVMGQSLGGSVAVHTVARSPRKDRVKALIIDSAFSGYRDIVRDRAAATVVLWPFRHPLSLLVTDRYSARRWIGAVSPVPVLIIHGGADGVVPARHAFVLSRSAGGSGQLLIVPGAPHIASLAERGARDTFMSFLHRAFAGNEGNGGGPDTSAAGAPEKGEPGE
jgi:pimeloyl-ACP methyl ester carboxylesterase